MIDEPGEYKALMTDLNSRKNASKPAMNDNVFLTQTMDDISVADDVSQEATQDVPLKQLHHAS